MVEPVNKAPSELAADAVVKSIFSAGVGYGFGWVVGKLTSADPVKFGLVNAATLVAHELIDFGVDRTSLELSDKTFVKEVSNRTIGGVSCIALLKLGLIGTGWGAFALTVVAYNLAETVLDRVAIKQQWSPLKTSLIKECSANTILTASLVTCAFLGIIGPVGIGIGAGVVTLGVALTLGRLHLFGKMLSPAPVKP